MDVFRAGVERILKAAKIAGRLERPPGGIGADLAFPCFELAKKLKKNPVLIAQDLAKKLRPSGVVKKVESAGPYVNFYADWGQVGSLVLKEILKAGSGYGKGKLQKGKLMVEFAHPNTHKAFHIGHVRNISLGESLSRILEFSGRKVVRANYQGDIGPHVARCLWAFRKLKKEKVPKGREPGRFLGEVYAEASRKVIGDDKLEAEVQEVNKKIYAGDRGWVPLWKKTRKWSLDYFEGIYREFGARFNRLYFESEVEKPGTKIAKKLLKAGKAKRSKGAIVMDLEKQGLGIWVLITQDETPLYSAKDLALAEMQVREHGPERIIHVVGSEQALHFRQLIKTLELTRPQLARKEVHLSYELVNLPEGKMKSREGKVILYEDLNNKLFELALKVARKENKGMAKAQLEKIAKSVALGALKYGMIKQSPEKVIIFDWDRALSLEGDTAPYVQYTHARCSSILRTGKVKKPGKFRGELLKEEKEKAVVKKLSEFPESIAKSAANLRPHYICNYVYELSDLFNNFYQSLPVLKAGKGVREARLALVFAVKTVLDIGLNLLGIDALERM